MGDFNKRSCFGRVAEEVCSETFLHIFYSDHSKVRLQVRIHKTSCEDISLSNLLLSRHTLIQNNHKKFCLYQLWASPRIFNKALEACLVETL
jgi:hypothetical protein